MTAGRRAPAGRCSGRMPGSRVILFLLLLAAISLTSCQTIRQRFEEESIPRLNRSPASHVGRAVVLYGVASHPVAGSGDHGASLGSYTLRDDSGQTIRVLTRRLPRDGEACRVSGFVGQAPEDALQPLVLEVRRSRPRRDLLLTIGLLLLVVGSLPPAVVRLARISGRRPGPLAAAAPSLDGPPVPPGVNCILDLVVVAGPDTGKRHSFNYDRILVGRPGMRRNDLSLDDQTVSRNQAVILRDPKVGGYKIRNEGLTNPLKVNGRHCDAVALRDGDLLTVGLTTMQVGYRIGDGGSRRPLAILLLVALALAAGTTALAGGEGAVELEALDLRELPEVTCRFRVFDAAGVERKGMGLDDFRLMVDGRTVKGAELRFEAAPGRRMPRLVVVVQATSEERGRGLFLLKTAVTHFLERWPAGGPVALVSHSGGARVEQEFTTDRRRILERLESIPLGPVEERGYYDALKQAAGLFGTGDSGMGAVVYFCRPGPFTREDMRLDSPKGLRSHPDLPVYPVLHPERDGGRTGEYLRQLALKLTAGFTGHYTLHYSSPGGEDNRVHSLRIDRISPAAPVSGAGCRYRAVSGSGLNTGVLLAAADRQALQARLAGALLGLLGGVLAFRWFVTGPGTAQRSTAGRKAVQWLRVHFLLAGAITGFLLSLLAGRAV